MEVQNFPASPVRFSLKGWLPSVRFIPIKKNLADNASDFRDFRDFRG